MNYDLIAFDMDGTLLNSKKQIDEKTLSSIKKAVQNNKIVCLSTGRSLAELEIFGGQLSDIQYFIAVSGAIIYDNKNKKIIHSNPIEEKTVRRLMSAADKKDLMIHIHSDKPLMEKEKLEQIQKYNMGVYKEMFEEIAFTVPSIPAFYEKNKIPVYKLNFYLPNPESREEFYNELLNMNLDITYSYAETASLECSAPNTSKGEGLKILCDKLEIPVEKTIAVGDAENDLPILKVAGLPVAMGNAKQIVKDCSKKIVKDNDHAGCAQAIEEFLFGNTNEN